MTANEITCAQGSVEWHAARLGKPTASCFDEIVTRTGARTASEGRKTYLASLLVERLTGVIDDHYTSDAMARGSELERQARAWTEVEIGADLIRPCGFFDAGRWGCSPDGLCFGDTRGVEIKCGLPHNHIKKMLLDVEKAAAQYIIQVQANLWITGAKSWSLVLYCDKPGIPSRIIEIERDEKLHAAFEIELPAFCDELDAAEKKLRGL